MPAAPQGSMPGVVADYRRRLGFRRYARAMTDLGGRFMLWHRQQRKLLAALDLDTGSLRLLNKNQLRGLSPRAHDLSEEAALTPYRNQHAGVSVLLLVPQAIDAVILRELQQATDHPGQSWHGHSGDSRAGVTADGADRPGCTAR